MCKEDWEMASRRLNCNSTYGYHCVPNKQFTSLIEFCYPKGPRFPFEKGTAFLLDITLIYYRYMFRKNNTLHCFITKKTFVCLNKIFFLILFWSLKVLLLLENNPIKPYIWIIDWLNEFIFNKSFFMFLFNIIYIFFRQYELSSCNFNLHCK